MGIEVLSDAVKHMKCIKKKGLPARFLTRHFMILPFGAKSVTANIRYMDWKRSDGSHSLLK